MSTVTWHDLPAAAMVVSSPQAAAIEGDPRAAARLWEHYQDAGPLIDPDPRVVRGVPGHAVTFLAPHEPGTTIALILHTITDRHREDLRPALLHPVEGTGLAAITVHLPAGLLCSYGLATLDPARDPSRLDREAWRSIVLATAPDRTPGPRTGHSSGELSLLALPGSEPLARYAAAVPGAPAGQLTCLDIPGGGTWPEPVRTWLYWPHPSHGPVSALAVLLDGDAWAGYLDAPALLDAAHARGDLPPTAALLPSSGERRDVRLGYDPRFARWLATDLLAAAAMHLPVPGDPQRRVIAGQSLGGAAALDAALRHPEAYRAVAAQSGAFWWPSAEGVDQYAVHGLVHSYCGPPLRVSHQVGTLEFHLLDANRDLVTRLRSAGHQVRSHEDAGGHDPAIWRPGLIRALGELLS